MANADIGIGKLIEQERHRDAIHVAVVPVEAGEKLAPGARVGIVDGKAMEVEPPIGIVDPFLLKVVRPGQRFYLFLFPGSITSLRHEWVHPAFGDLLPQPPPVDPKEESRKWVAAWAEKLGLSAGAVMSAADQWLLGDDYYCFSGIDTPDAAYSGAKEFWKHYEVLTGKAPGDIEERVLLHLCVLEGKSMTPERRMEFAELFIEEREQANGCRESLYRKIKDFLSEEMGSLRERCAKLAEESAIPGHAVQAPSCVEIAKKIRELTY